jgi:hypothetical protein
MRMPISRVRWVRVYDSTVETRHTQHQRDRAEQRSNPRGGADRVHLGRAHFAERHRLENLRIRRDLPEDVLERRGTELAIRPRPHQQRVHVWIAGVRGQVDVPGILTVEHFGGKILVAATGRHPT